MNSSPYSDNPFDGILTGPNPAYGPGPQAAKPQAAPQQSTQIDDLLNPFAVLGMENKTAKSPVFGQPAWAAPSGAGGSGWAQAPQQQNGWVNPAPSNYPGQQSFTPPPQPQGYNGYPTSTSPAFGAPQQPYGQPQNFGPSPNSGFGVPQPQAMYPQQSVSPAFGMPPQQSTSPAFGQRNSATYGQQNAFAPQQFGSSPGFVAPKPVTSDADFSLFEAPKPPAPRSPVQQQVQQAPSSPSFNNGFSQANNDDGWSNDFTISWDDAPKKPTPRESAPREVHHEEEEVEEYRPAPRSAPGATKYQDDSVATNAEGNKLEGEILARISVRTLIVKEWKQTFWIITNGKLLMYRSKDDYLYNPVGVQVKKDVPIRDNLRCSEITCKPYKGYGDLYHFTFEELLDYGPSLIAKFASTDIKEVRNLRKILIGAIIDERKRRVGHHNSHHDEVPRTRTPVEGGDDKYSKWGNINH